MRILNSLVVRLFAVALILALVPITGAESIPLKDGGSMQGTVLSMEDGLVTVEAMGNKLILPAERFDIPDFNSLISEAEKALESGEFEHAKELCNKVLFWDSNNERAGQILENAEQAKVSAAEPKPSASLVATNELGDRLEILSFNPPLPAKFQKGQHLEVRIAYTIASVDKASLGVRPVDQTDTMSNPKQYEKGSGEATVSFSMLSVGQVKGIRVYIGIRPTILELTADVDAEWISGPTSSKNEAGDSLSLISFDPPIPAVLEPGQLLKAKVAYTLSSAENGTIRAEPYTTIGYVPEMKEHLYSNITKGSGETEVGFSVNTLDKDEKLKEVKLALLPGGSAKPVTVICDFDAKWEMSPLPITLPEGISDAVRPAPESAVKWLFPSGKRHTLTKQAKEDQMALLIAELLLPAGTPRGGGTIVIKAKPGEEFTIGVKAKYSTKEPTKLAANIKPDVSVFSRWMRDKKISSDLYSNAAHFDTGSRAGYEAVNGDGEIEFTLTSLAPDEPGRYEKILQIGLFEKEQWSTLLDMRYQLALEVDSE